MNCTILSISHWWFVDRFCQPPVNQGRKGFLVLRRSLTVQIQRSEREGLEVNTGRGLDGRVLTYLPGPL